MFLRMKKVEIDVATLKSVNGKLVNQLSDAELGQCPKVVGIPTSVPNDLLEANFSKAFDKLGVHVEGRESGHSKTFRHSIV